MLDSSRFEWRVRTAGLAAGVVLLSLSTASCFTTQAKSAPRAFYPPPVQSKVVIPVGVPILQPDTSLNLAPPDSSWEVVTLELPQLPAFSKPPTQPVRSAPAKTTGPNPPAPAPPKIIQLFSEKQKLEYNKIYEESQDRIKRDLAILEKKSLTPAQRRAMERIVTFQKQAEQEYDRDLITAVNLARRAAALSADLRTATQ